VADMVFKKFKKPYKSAPKRSFPRRSGYSKRKVSRIAKSFRLNTHSFTRFSAAYTVEMTGTEQPLSFEFKLSDLYSYSEFTTLFDKYKLTRAQVFIQMVNNPDGAFTLNGSGAVGTGNACNFYPKMWYIADHDDSSTTSIAAIKERVGVKMCVIKPNVIKKISVKPACAVQLYKTALTSGYGPKFGQYIDMANSDVPHYGLKCVFDPLGLDPLQTYSFRYEWKLHFTCKDVQ